MKKDDFGAAFDAMWSGFGKWAETAVSNLEKAEKTFANDMAKALLDEAKKKTEAKATSNHRPSGVPTNNPHPTHTSVTLNENGTHNIRLDWATYLQGDLPADFLMIFWNKNGAVDSSSSAISVNVNPDSSSYYIFEGVAPKEVMAFGIAAARRTENGIEIGAIQSPADSPNWRAVSGLSRSISRSINEAMAQAHLEALRHEVRQRRMPQDAFGDVVGRTQSYWTNSSSNPDKGFEAEINGVKVKGQKSVEIDGNGRVKVDGYDTAAVADKGSFNLTVTKGCIGNLKVSGSVTASVINGDVKSGGDVTTTTVNGDVKATGNVEAKTVNGDIRAGGDVTTQKR